jgi:hypothetical protein
MPALGQVLLDALKAQGAREVFGIAGDFVLPFCKLIEESGTLPFYTLSYEPAWASRRMRRRGSTVRLLSSSLHGARGRST